MDSKHLILLLPFGSALSWAIIYVVSEKSYHHISVPTNLIAVGVSTALAGLVLAFFLKESIDFTPYLNHPSKHLFWIVFTISMLGSIFLHLSLRSVNATYTALIESLYIVLAPIFAYVFFADRQWTTSTLIGAALILSGIAFVVHDKAKQLSQG